MFGSSLMYGACVTGHSPYWRARHDKHYYDDDDDEDDGYDNERDNDKA